MKKPSLVLLAHEVGPFGGQERALERFVLDLLHDGVKMRVVAFRVSETVSQHVPVTVIWRPPGPFVIRFLWFALASSIILRRFPESTVISCGAITLARVDAIWMHFWH